MEDNLNILIVTLSTGDELITNVKDHFEKRDGVDQKVCYNMVYPFVLTNQGPVKDGQVGVLLKPWKVFSSDISFLIGFDQVVNMCTPQSTILEQYKEAVDGLIDAVANAEPII
tara:strand:- start:158 stop:496 length:339 start_codon:yes stop_codon:yes gene_type:complete